MDIQTVEAVGEGEDGSDNGGRFDFAAFASRLLACPLECPCGAMLPEVDAVTELVVGVLAGDELEFASEDGIRHAFVAAVEGEHCALVGK